MPQINLEGLGVALITPFKSDRTVDYGTLERLTERVIAGGVDYLVVLGTTAETPTLSQTEKKQIISLIKDVASKRLPLVLGVGGNCTEKVIREMQEYDLEGYSAILSVTPYYNKPSQEGLFQHFKMLAESSSLPIVLYNVPGRTGVNMTARTTCRLSFESPNIIAIKEASGKIDQGEEIIKNCAEGFKLISGNDGDTTALMEIGGTGVISVLANALPEVMAKIVKACKAKNFEEASNLQQHISTLIGYLFEDGNPGGVKALLSQMGLIENILRLPLIPVSREVENKLKKFVDFRI